MGKVYEFVEEIDKSISTIRGVLQCSNISMNEQKVQNGIKYICSNGATFARILLDFVNGGGNIDALTPENVFGKKEIK